VEVGDEGDYSVVLREWRNL